MLECIAVVNEPTHAYTSTTITYYFSIAIHHKLWCNATNHRYTTDSFVLNSSPHPTPFPPPPQLSCRLPIDALLQLASDRGGVTFYEMYIEDGTGRLYPVPVVNHSQRDNGALVNGANVTYDK